VIDLAKIVRGEAAENIERKAFTLTEEVAIKRKLEPLIKAQAEARMKAGKRPCATLAQGKGRARDLVAKRTGKSHATLAKAEAVVAAAEAAPKNRRLQKLVEDMDRTGNANNCFKRLKTIRQSASIRREPPPLPGNGPYRAIVVDPPWTYERQDDLSHRAAAPYPTMSVDQICKLDVPSIAHKDCIIFLWTTNAHMRFAYQVLDAWGFKEKTILTWVKDRFGMGNWLRGQTEHAILATRASPTVSEQATSLSTVLHGPLRANSQKPDEFYALVEKLCPAPSYCELFGRVSRPNWDSHGNEIQKLKKRAA
jgi:N6-adenosine-specific RNA methylase IME4